MERSFHRGNITDQDGAAENQYNHLSVWVWLFVIGLIVPLFVYVGPLRLSVYRLILIASFIPTFLFWLSGRAGRIRLPDFCVVAVCLWSTVSMSVMDGGFVTAIEPIGILWIETLGGYLLGRCYIRTPQAFWRMTRLLFHVSLFLTPFAIYELFLGPSPIIDFFRKLGPTYLQNPNPGRLGLERVQGPFTHPIHFGVFFGGLIGLFYYVLGYGRLRLYRIASSGLALFLCFCSLSSGPLVAAMGQGVFLLWDGIMKSVRTRWYVFSALALLGFIAVDLVSNRSPFEVLISYFAFSSHTAYNRILIWIHGSASILANPVFGIGLTGEWVRAYWMPPSVDMFWIVGAMRHGIVVGIGYAVVFFSIFFSVVYRDGLGDRVRWYRMGYICSMTGLFVVGWTVHFWDALFVFFMFLLASGIWILDWEDNVELPRPDAPNNNRLMPYTRFPMIK